MNLKKAVRTVVACSALAIASHANAATLKLSNGVLNSATGVDVGGVMYNVFFGDATCNYVFNGCSASTFAFSNGKDAILAAQALLDQVFIDGPVFHFDSQTNNSYGCSNAVNCYSLIPYGKTGSLVNLAFALNNAVGDDIAAKNFDPSQPTVDYSKIDNVQFAFFYLAPTPPAVPAVVPEPGSLALMGLAFGALAYLRRRKA